MYTTDHIFLVIQIKDLLNEDGKLITPFKLGTGIKPSVSHLQFIFQCVVRKSTAHVGTKKLNMCLQAGKCFRGFLVGITQ